MDNYSHFTCALFKAWLDIIYHVLWTPCPSGYIKFSSWSNWSPSLQSWGERVAPTLPLGGVEGNSSPTKKTSPQSIPPQIIPAFPLSQLFYILMWLRDSRVILPVSGYWHGNYYRVVCLEMCFSFKTLSPLVKACLSSLCCVGFSWFLEHTTFSLTSGFSNTVSPLLGTHIRPHSSSFASPLLMYLQFLIHTVDIGGLRK